MGNAVRCAEYTAFDRLAALLRFRAASPHVLPNTLVCDIGCGPSAPFLQLVKPRVAFGVGLDYRAWGGKTYDPPIVLADVTRGLPVKSGLFDHAIMLAVLEHLREPTITLRETFRILAPGGTLIMTWPAQIVDPLLSLLHRIRVVSDEMEPEGHQKRIPLSKLLTLLREIGFESFTYRKFGFGLNNLLVAYKP